MTSAKKILIINGPNLNLLGKREVDIYGSVSFEHYFEKLCQRFPEVELEYFQSNHEGEIIDKIHEAGFHYSGFIFNGGGFTHTSVAIRDAFAGVPTPMVEVHISNIHAREQFRKNSFTAEVAIGLISGLGLQGYQLAIEFLKDR